MVLGNPCGSSGFMDSCQITTVAHRVVLQEVASSFASLTAGILHGAGLSQLPKQRYQPRDLHADQAPNSHVKYVW